MNIPGISLKIKTTEDDKLQIRLLSSLIAILPSQVPRERDKIVTSSVVYETAHSILSRGMVESRSVLSFLTVLLRAASRSEDATRAPAARELLRRSGCLQDLLDLFLGIEMMEHEYLKILCDCLVESCKHSEYNQNYCNTLIPACLQQCDTNNNEILKLLQCLLLNNTRNINTFVKCNGIGSVFTRDSIQDSSRRELLSIVVQNSTAAKLLQRNTDLVESLFAVEEDNQLNHQGSWKMVEWASVILFHIASHVERTDNPGQRSSNVMDIENAIENTGSSLSELSVSFLFKPNWDKIQPTKVLKNNKTGNTISEYIVESFAKSIKKSALEALSGDQIGSHSSIVKFITENKFKPTFVSTPKRKFKLDNKTQVAELSKEQKWNNDLQRNLCCNNSAPVVKKKLSTSARLFNIVNNSCISIYNMMGNVFIRSAPDKWPREDLLKPNIEADTSKCRFNDNMKQREFLHTGSKGSVQLKPLTRRFGISNKYRKGIIKKLKTGINFYGCDFEKIAQAMWSQEKQMTAQVLYSIYRKFIVK